MPISIPLSLAPFPPPVDPYSDPSLKSWLEDLGARGLLEKKDTNVRLLHYAIFHGCPHSARYLVSRGLADPTESGDLMKQTFRSIDGLRRKGKLSTEVWILLVDELLDAGAPLPDSEVTESESILERSLYLFDPSLSLRLLEKGAILDISRQSQIWIVLVSCWLNSSRDKSDADWSRLCQSLHRKGYGPSQGARNEVLSGNIVGPQWPVEVRERAIHIQACFRIMEAMETQASLSCSLPPTPTCLASKGRL